MITFKNKHIMLFLVEKIHELQGTPCPDLNSLPREYVEKMYQNEFSEKFLTDLFMPFLNQILIACKNELKQINNQQKFLDLFFNDIIHHSRTLRNEAGAEINIDALILLWEFNHAISHMNSANINFLRSQMIFVDGDRFILGSPGNLALTKFQENPFVKMLNSYDAHRKYDTNTLISSLWSSVGFTVIADGFPADSMVTDSFKLWFNTFYDLAKHFLPAVTALPVNKTV